MFQYKSLKCVMLGDRVDWPVSEIRPGEEKDLWLEVHEPRCSPRMQPGSPEGRPGSPPGQPVLSRKKIVPKRVVTLQKVKQLQDRLLRGNQPCGIHLKVRKFAILQGLLCVHESYRPWRMAELAMQRPGIADTQVLRHTQGLQLFDACTQNKKSKAGAWRSCTALGVQSMRLDFRVPLCTCKGGTSQY